jgi:hypothetical protein
MFQPEVKLEFVRRYCPPKAGWKVFVDIDPSEEGRTGGDRTTVEAKHRQEEMQSAADTARQQLEVLGVQVGGDRKNWLRKHGLPPVAGDRDILAFHVAERLCLIGEAEGESSGQPEQKLYKAIGQLVMAASNGEPEGWQKVLVLVVHGDKITAHLQRATALAQLAISAVALGITRPSDQWLFQDTLPSKLLSGELHVPAAAKLMEART